MTNLQNSSNPNQNNATSKIQTLETMASIADDLRRQGKTIVFTNGCFDILHLGHIRYLRQAKSLGDVLVIGVNTDSSVKSFKGDLRPIVPEDERAELLAALEMVDYVVKFSERTPENIILALKPHIQVKGGDYTPDQLPEAKAVYSYGGKVEIVPFIKGKATTGIIEKILQVYGNK
jgi:D-beta-D-heptose 7-phosphate kinase/D-beta-D-heptose 1-phosphate adenosyltransferase